MWTKNLVEIDSRFHSGGKNLTFNDVYAQFIKSTKEKFPVDVCIKQNEKESNVFDSNVPYLCLVIDKRFDNYWNLIILYPYICKESEVVITFGWVDRNGNIFCNIENSTQLWDEFVVGFREYKEDDSDKCLWNEFMDKIEEQYED